MLIAIKSAWAIFRASKAFQIVALVTTAIVAFFFAQRRAEKRGADGVEADITEDRIERMESGNEAVQIEAEETRDASNSDLVNRLRGRDGDWGRM